MGMFDGKDTLWVIHIGKDDKIPLRAREEGFVCIGWTDMGDLSQYTTREAMKAAMAKTWPAWKTGKVRSCYGQVFRFAHVMQIGDPVVFPIKQTREIAIGRIKSNQRFMPAGMSSMTSTMRTSATLSGSRLCHARPSPKQPFTASVRSHP